MGHCSLQIKIALANSFPPYISNNAVLSQVTKTVVATVEKHVHQTAAAIEHFRKAHLGTGRVDDTRNEGQQEIYRSNLRLLGYYNAHVAPWVCSSSTNASPYNRL